MAELIMLLVGVAFFGACAVVCGMAAFGESAGLPGGRVLPVIGFVGSLAMVSFAIWRIVTLHPADRS